MPPTIRDDVAHSTAPDAVVMVHGLWMTGLELAVLGSRLAGCGFDPVRFHYRSVARPVSHNAARLVRFVTSLDRSPVHLIGHSLGGLVVLQALAECPELPPGRAVLLGSPVAGSGVARRLARTGAGAWVLGRSLEQGLDGKVVPDVRDRQIGAIAGTRGLGIGRVLGGLAQPSDGTVAVAETRLSGAAHCTVAATHMGLVVSRDAASQACAFLHTGRFLGVDRVR